jgi:hypothetical protein
LRYGPGVAFLFFWGPEEYLMHRVHRCIASLCLTAALAAPVAVLAARATQEPDHDRNRVYDRDHKDYHQWDDHEKDAWGHFLGEKHRKDHEFTKASRREQSEYWNWRHGHPD